MFARKLRRLLFENLIFNLALLLGTAEAGLIVWGHALLSDGDSRRVKFEERLGKFDAALKSGHE